MSILTIGLVIMAVIIVVAAVAGIVYVTEWTGTVLP